LGVEREVNNPSRKKYCYETSTGGQGPPTAVEPIMVVMMMMMMMMKTN
jgi:hypothetical protein